MVVDAIGDDHLMSILEWSPHVIVTGRAMPKVASWGIRVDAVVVDVAAHNESVVNDTFAQVGHAHVIDGSEGQAEAVLTYLRSKNQKALQVLIQTPEKCFGDWEHADDFQITLIDSSTKWSRIQEGRYQKWIPEGSALFTHGDQLSVTPARLVGNRITAASSGIVEVRSPVPFWIGEQHH